MQPKAVFLFCYLLSDKLLLRIWFQNSTSRYTLHMHIQSNLLQLWYLTYNMENNGIQNNKY